MPIHAILHEILQQCQWWENRTNKWDPEFLKKKKKKRKNTPTKNNKDHIIISVRLSTLKQIFKKTQNVKLSTIVKYNTNKMIC